MTKQAQAPNAILAEAESHIRNRYAKDLERWRQQSIRDGDRSRYRACERAWWRLNKGNPNLALKKPEIADEPNGETLFEARSVAILGNARIAAARTSDTKLFYRSSHALWCFLHPSATKERSPGRR